MASVSFIKTKAPRINVRGGQRPKWDLGIRTTKAQRFGGKNVELEAGRISAFWTCQGPHSHELSPCASLQGAAQGQANSHPSVAGEGRVTYLQVCGPAKLLMIQRRAPNPFTRTALSSVGLKNNNNNKKV